MEDEKNNRNGKDSLKTWGSAGIILAGLLLSLVIVSSRFEWSLPGLEKPVTALATLLVAAGVIYLFMYLRLFRSDLSRPLLFGAIGFGLLLRAMMFFSTPMLEDDWYRYLWDGGVAANGFSPYLYSLDQVKGEESEAPSGLKSLATDSGPVAERVNHPDLRTIYPPVAQSAFAAAYLIKPWSLGAWRLVILLFDCATLALIIYFLRSSGLPSGYSLIYWLNPLFIKEMYNSAHMDVVMFPFLLGSLILAGKKKYLWASLLLALAAGVKVWPVMLLPIILRPLLTKPKRLVAPVSLFGIMMILLFLPVYLGGLDSASGFTAYGKKWEMNDALYMLLFWISKYFTGLMTDVDVWQKAHVVTRLIVGVLLVGWIIWLCERPAKDPLDMVRKGLYAVAALFILSPTQFPWYYAWMLPLLAIAPRTSLLLLTALLPLYYLRFHFSYRENVAVFDNWIVWIEYVPVWALLIYEWKSSRHGAAFHGEGG